MNSARLNFLRWLCEELIYACLRTSYCAWKQAEHDGNESLASALESRFLKLVNGMDCYPCRVEWGPGLPLLISSRPDVEEPYWADEDDELTSPPAHNQVQMSP